MATQAGPPITCTVCRKAATTHCAGCVSDNRLNANRTLTYYCGKTCQAADWQSHKPVCQSTQAKNKLLRAGDLLQEVFFATRMQAFDLNLAKVARANDGNLHIFDASRQPHWIIPFSSTLTADLKNQRAVLSYLAGGDFFTGFMFVLCKKAFEGGYVTKIEEMDIHVFDSRVAVFRHSLQDVTTANFSTCHHVVRITLKDNTTWVMDLAGAQYGQHRAILPFADYSRDYVARVISRRPWGSNAVHIERSLTERHGQEGQYVAITLSENLEYQIDELEEWIFHHVHVSDLLKNKTVESEYQRLKHMLVDHVAAAAREYVKLAHQDSTNKAKPIWLTDDNMSEPELSKMSVENRGRFERKIARKKAAMSPESRRLMEEQKAKGTAVMMF